MDKDPPTRRKRWPYVIGTLVTLLFVMVYLFMKDDPLGNHSDLAPVRNGPTSESSAAFEAWLAACAKLDRDVIRDAQQGDPLFFNRLYGSEPWEPEPIEKIITVNKDALAAARSAGALGHFTLPPCEDFTQIASHLQQFQSMAKLLRIVAAERLVAGKRGEAGDLLLLGVQFGDNATSEANTMIDFLVGVTCQAIAYAGAERMITPEMPESDLLRLDAKLSAGLDVHAALAESYRREFNIFANSLGRIDELDPNLLGPPGHRLPRFLLKPNRTINKNAEITRVAVANSTAPPALRKESPSIGTGWLSSNAAGEQILSVNAEMGRIAKKADASLGQRRLLRLKIALVRYHRDQRTLPPTLSALVPNYIEAVPADPYDSAPIRYDATRGAIWVLGDDLSDGGGSTAPSPNGFRSRDADPTMFVLRFAKP